MWKTIKKAITAAAKKTLGESRHKLKSWYNDECQNAIIKRKESRRHYLNSVAVEFIFTKINLLRKFYSESERVIHKPIISQKKKMSNIEMFLN